MARVEISIYTHQGLPEPLSIITETGIILHSGFRRAGMTHGIPKAITNGGYVIALTGHQHRELTRFCCCGRFEGILAACTWSDCIPQSEPLVDVVDEPSRAWLYRFNNFLCNLGADPAGGDEQTTRGVLRSEIRARALGLQG